MKHIPYFFLICFSGFLACQPDKRQPATNDGSLNWEQTLPGTYKSTAGNPSAFNLLTVANKKPRTEAITTLGDAPLPVDLKEIKAIVV